MKKILFFMVISISFLFSINVQTASKDELMCIKGIGDKKADAILTYRKSTKLKSAEDLAEIKGFGKVLVSNVKNNIKSVACGGKKSAKKSSSPKSTIEKDSSKKSSVNKSKTKKVETNKTETKKAKTKKVEIKKTETKKPSSKEKE